MDPGGALTPAPRPSRGSSAAAIALGVIALLLAVVAIVLAIALFFVKKGNTGPVGPIGPSGPSGPTGNPGVTPIFGVGQAPYTSAKFWTGPSNVYALPWYLANAPDQGPTTPFCYNSQSNSSGSSCFVSRGGATGPLGVWAGNGIYGFYNAGATAPLTVDLYFSLRCFYAAPNSSTTVGPPIVASIYPIFMTLVPGSVVPGSTGTYAAGGAEAYPATFTINPVDNGQQLQGYFYLSYEGRVTLPPTPAGSPPQTVMSLALDMTGGGANPAGSALQTTYPGPPQPTDYVFTISQVNG